jgi:CBS domain-containing protein
MTDTRREIEGSILSRSDDPYFDEEQGLAGRSFDVRLLHEPVTMLSTRSPLLFTESMFLSDAMRSMQAEHRGCVLITEDGTANTPLKGIFTERDIMLRVINRGRNPVQLPLHEVMSSDPEYLRSDAPIAWALNMMSVGGFRHVPVVNALGCPVAVISVRDIVEFLVEAFPAEILNLPPDFGMQARHTRDGA